MSDIGRAIDEKNNVLRTRVFPVLSDAYTCFPDENVKEDKQFSALLQLSVI
jgi:hypothetical protein